MKGPRFFNSATLSVSERLLLRGGSGRMLPIQVLYGVYEHPMLGLTLIDTGYGPAVTEGDERSLALRLYARFLNIGLNDADAPDAVLRREGWNAGAVQTVILTHFHADHIGRLKEFPNARILADADAWAVLKDRSRLGQLHAGCFAELLPDDFEARMTGFEALPLVRHPLLGPCRDLTGAGEVLAVPLPGHALGHHGVLFSNLERPLLYAVDTQWLFQAVAEDRLPGYPARAIYSSDRQARESVERVRAFARAGGEVVLCHDPNTGPHRL